MKDVDRRVGHGFRWMWQLGLALCLIGRVAGCVVGVISDIAPGVNVETEGSMWVLLVVALVVPVLEEVSFRGWAVNKRWVNVCAVLLFYLLFPTSNLSLLVPLTLAYVVLMEWRGCPWWEGVMALSISLLFALMHVINFEEITLGLALGAVGHFGFGLVCSYLVLWRGLWASMALHIANNLVWFLVVWVVML